MQPEPAFEAAAASLGWTAAVPDADAAADERMTAWVGGVSLLMWAFATALAINWL